MLWVDGQKIKKADVPADAKATAPYTEDDVVRDFRGWQEAVSFAANATDYIGNLPGPHETGTWIRLGNDGLNIVGEYHDYVSAEQTVAAVRPRSFIDEQFATDELPDASAFRAA
jgi:hypothetical protein